jgi:putative transposase
MAPGQAGLGTDAGRFPACAKSGPTARTGRPDRLDPGALGLHPEIVTRSDDQKGFVVLPKRWIVERTFGWFGRYRRLSKDYEELPASSESMIYIAMIHLMLRRLAPP